MREYKKNEKLLENPIESKTNLRVRKNTKKYQKIRKTSRSNKIGKEYERIQPNSEKIVEN
mgnify:CR=1 FL=1